MAKLDMLQRQHRQGLAFDEVAVKAIERDSRRSLDVAKQLPSCPRPRATFPYEVIDPFDQTVRSDEIFEIADHVAHPVVDKLTPKERSRIRRAAADHGAPVFSETEAPGGNDREERGDEMLLGGIDRALRAEGLPDEIDGD